MSLPRTALALAALALAAACDDPAAAVVPPPREIAADDIGYFCGMYVAEHEGPKGQVFIAGEPEPYWFATARDAIAFQHLDETPTGVTAFYVTDWATPVPASWIAGEDAWYVVGSSYRGGMGAPEMVPFAERIAAATFALEFGGAVLAYADIPTTFVLGAPPPTAEP